MDFGMFNGPSYESSGGVWITAEYSMQEICWSKKNITGAGKISLMLDRPQVNPRARQTFPLFNPETGLVEKPVIPERKTYYKEIAVLALPAAGIVAPDKVINLSDRMQPDGKLDWEAPPGEWIIYRFGHTTMGTLIQPAQWEATGFECDKMSEAAVSFHIDHVVGEIKKHISDLIGTGFTHVHFDSYEAGDPTWTPAMPQEFLKRRGYNLILWLPTFAGRVIGSKDDSIKFRKDFNATIKDLYRDIYFTTIAKKLKAANLTFLCEPYGGPWRQDEVMPLIPAVMTEFWTHKGVYSPYELEPTVAALRKSGQNIIDAEAFTGDPSDSKWSETPAWMKPIGDAAFCDGVNNMVLHRFVQQPWDDNYLPGATMGQWGTHFDRTQTWWKPAKALLQYWQRCQALLQWGNIVMATPGDFEVKDVTDSIVIKSIHRKDNNSELYFIANTSRKRGSATCTFNVKGLQPELWDPVTATMHTVNVFQNTAGRISFNVNFDEAQSFFVVFRNKITKQLPVVKDIFSADKEIARLSGPWKIQFDSVWGGPAKPVIFDSLQDWTTRAENGIKYFSGTATYNKIFNLPVKYSLDKKSSIYLDLGIVKHIARVRLNNKDLGVVWTAPWQVQIPAGLLRKTGNELEIEITNVWANRLIGDEQEPADCEWLPGHMNSGSFLKEFPDWFLKRQPRPSKGRYCFTTWNYFTKDSPLVSSGLLGPVRIIKNE